jgi:hypothetical protein
LGAFLALRLSGGLRRRGYLLLARHFGFSPVSRRGLSGRWHDALLMSRAVLALSTIGGVLARIKSRKNDDSPRSTRNSDSVGSWSSTSATHMQFLPCRLAAYSARSAAPMSNAGSLSCPACVAVTATLIVTIPGPYCRVVEQVPQIYRAAQTRGPERIGWALARLVKNRPSFARSTLRTFLRRPTARSLGGYGFSALLSPASEALPASPRARADYRDCGVDPQQCSPLHCFDMRYRNLVKCYASSASTARDGSLGTARIYR